MTNHEHTPSEEQVSKNERIAIAVEAMEILTDLLIDENGHAAASDIVHVTWDQVQSPNRMLLEDDRQFYYNQMHSLYTEALGRLYPNLRSLKTAEEMLMELATIEDLPRCDGWFAMSDYRTGSGISRGISLILIDLGDMGVSTFASVMEDDEGIVKSYGIKYQVDGKIIGSFRVVAKDDITSDDGLFAAVHPSQVSNLGQILYGNVPEYELDMKLAEVKILSEGMMTEAELEDFEAYARQRYYAAVECRTNGMVAGMDNLTIDDLYKMRSILIERMRQLELEQNGF